VEQPAFTFERAAGPARVVQPIARIVDPAAADAEDEPLFASPRYADERPQKGKWLSLFGRPRHETGAQPAPPRVVQSAVAEPIEEGEAENAEDLEIPSFLRRLAN
jgi:cell division protein FtsZ